MLRFRVDFGLLNFVCFLFLLSGSLPISQQNIGAGYQAYGTE